VTVSEEPALERRGKVVFRGELRFNDPVDPKTLAPLVAFSRIASQRPD
jgi:hypothetical protein